MFSLAGVDRGIIFVSVSRTINICSLLNLIYLSRIVEVVNFEQRWRSSAYYYCRWFLYINFFFIEFDLSICSGLLKLSTVYSGKRLAVIEDLPEAARVSEYEHNIYALWKIILGRYIHMYDVYVQGIGIGRDPASV